MLRECVAGCLGALYTTSHQNVKLKLRLPEGSPAKFIKINGALQITKRATGRDAEASLGDLRFGDKRGMSDNKHSSAVISHISVSATTGVTIFLFPCENNHLLYYHQPLVAST